MLAVLAASLLLASSAPQAADAPGAIVGRVLIRGDNQPVANARVAVVLIRHASAPSPGPPPQVLTAPDGSYSVAGLPPGEYRINVQKTGLAEGPGTTQRTETVVVTAGQTARCPDVFLDRGGAIAGRILDSNGEPMVDARVAALTAPPAPPTLAARGYHPPPNRLVPAGRSAQTNDLGEFRIFGLLPGDYVVAASADSSPFITSTAPTTVATTYFPGVTDQAGAQTITVTAGQTAEGVEIRMATTAAFVVSGTVVDAEGRPLQGAMVTVMAAGGPLGGHGGSHTDPQGRFLVGSLPDGTYSIGVASSNVGPGATLRLPKQVTVTVAGASVSGIRLVLVPK